MTRKVYTVTILCSLWSSVSNWNLDDGQLSLEFPLRLLRVRDNVR